MIITCLNCREDFESSESKRKFCSRSCSSTYNNRSRRRNGEEPGTCILCGVKLKRSSQKYCSQKCKNDHNWLQAVNFFEENGFFEGLNTPSKIQQKLKRYVLEKRGHSCEICKNTEWMGKPIGLILDHIDGNSENNELDNLRLVCGNCDMQLPTYKNRNRGNGRAYRRERYNKGQSY